MGQGGGALVTAVDAADQLGGGLLGHGAVEVGCPPHFAVDELEVKRRDQIGPHLGHLDETGRIVLNGFVDKRPQLVRSDLHGQDLIGRLRQLPRRA
ncbi:hypothetical protein ACQP2X_49690 [Actinoplanes sp. CA-131856]